VLHRSWESDTTTTDGADGLASTACVIRDYDADGNRTALQTTPAAADGSCQTGSSPTRVTTKTWTYDDADRLTGGYVYDALGRQTTIPERRPAATAGGSPGDLSLGYYDTDALHTQTQRLTAPIAIHYQRRWDPGEEDWWSDSDW